MALSRDAILAIKDTDLVSVDIPEWATKDDPLGRVYVRPMTGKERDAYDMETVGSGRPENMRARMAVRAICDENGQRIFNDSDAEMLGNKSATALDRVYRAMERHNKLGAAEIEEAKKG